MLNQQVQSFSASLDSVLQDYAFRAFVRPRTGIPYDGNVPLNFTGIKVAALRELTWPRTRTGVPYDAYVPSNLTGIKLLSHRLTRSRMIQQQLLSLVRKTEVPLPLDAPTRPLLENDYVL
ncbi:hypothetical protein HAX54_044151 [Datura stramonium]|uniref:Uncharacterized protein n=1 Tax=Datura stramonium TaxID=4076 RepID=A0ABS8RP79_DATST|nr:hypothetical protein [Datura stramonium]